VIALAACDFAGQCGVDTSSKLTAVTASRIADSQILGRACKFVARYVFFGPPRPQDIDIVEAGLIVGAGLGLILVQHPRLPEDNILTPALGVADATWAVKNAIAAGCDPSVMQPLDGKPPWLVVDMEGVRDPGPQSFGYAQSWMQYVSDRGFRAASYIGYDSGLTTAGLASLDAQFSPGWWCDFAPLTTRPVPPRGYDVKQHVQVALADALRMRASGQRGFLPMAGIPVDPDEAFATGSIVGFVAAPLAQNIETSEPTQAVA